MAGGGNEWPQHSRINVVVLRVTSVDSSASISQRIRVQLDVECAVERVLSLRRCSQVVARALEIGI